jgi:hypothetical protein
VEELKLRLGKTDREAFDLHVNYVDDLDYKSSNPQKDNRTIRTNLYLFSSSLFAL